MSLNELDFTGDELIQTLYFPETPLDPSCDVWGCSAAGSEWVPTVSYWDPDLPPKVYAEMAVAMNFGVFLDPRQVCSVTQGSLTGVSAASYEGPAVAPDSIATVFGSNLAPTTEWAERPLPTSLAGITLTLTDSSGVGRLAPVIFASPKQINFLLPAGSVTGQATISVERMGGGLRSTGGLVIQPVTPALFAANGDGQGVAAGMALRVAANGSERWQQLFECGSAVGRWVSVPVARGGPDDVFLILFGTGIRGRSSLSAVEATIGGLAAEVTYAGAQGYFEGLDQVNLRLRDGLGAGTGVELGLTLDGFTANTVTVEFGP